MRRPITKGGGVKPFELRHADHPLGADYDIDPDTGCWLWKWTRNTDGYARVMHLGRMCGVSRLVVEASEGVEVRHSQECSSRSCINPAHLRLGTHTDNMRDALFDGHKRSLTQEQAAEIRRRLAKGEVPMDIARDYGVSRQVVYGIKHRRTYTYDITLHDRH